MTATAFFSGRDPLGEYRWRNIHGPFAAAGEAVWAYGGPGSVPSRQILVPHWKACLALVRRWSEDGGELQDCRVMVLGPVASAQANQAVHGIEIIALRLHLESVTTLLDLAPGDIVGCDVEQAALPSVDRLRRLGEAGATQAEIGAALLDWLALRGVDQRCTLASSAARLLRASKGRSPVRQVADRLGASERSLRRNFRQAFGIGPKAYARTLRIKNLLMEADRCAKPDWADLAVWHGYADQSHMLNEVRAMSGHTPVQLHAMRRGGRTASQPACQGTVRS